MQWHSRNKKYYKTRGYSYSSIGTKFTVKISDLPRDSHCKVRVECQCCGKVDLKSYSRFTTEYTDRQRVYWCKECKKKNRGWAKRHSYEEVKKAFDDRGYTLLTKEYKDNKQLLEYTCACDNTVIQRIRYNDLQQGHGCPLCKGREHSERTSMDGHWNWQGGISGIKEYLRHSTADWRTQQLHRTHYKCELTGNGGELEVHHRFSFGKIVEIVLEELGFTVKQINEYSMDELQSIIDLFIEKHSKLSQPIVLSIGIHHLYHSIYGKYDNTPKQFEEFKTRWIAGEFDG